MKITIKKDKKTKEPIGWSVKAETPEEINTVNTMRNLQFFGYGENHIEYNGRTDSDDTNNNAGTLHWIQKKYQKS